VAAAQLACEVCGAEMQRGQDWCLECGRAAPGRLGARPGWRAAFTVVGVTLLLVCCAVVASYAALTSKAERSASAPSPGSGQPLIAATPPVVQAAPGPPIQPGPTGPGTTPPPAVVAPPAHGTPLVAVPQTATPPTNTPVIPPTAQARGLGIQTPATGTQTPAPGTQTPATGTRTPAPGTQTPATGIPTPGTGTQTPASGTQTPATGTQTPATATPAPGASSTAQIVPFKAGAASTYDPAKRAGAEFGPAANAIDKKPDSVWDVVVPADGQPIGAGLLLKLGAPLALQSLKLATPTPGFRVELYGAVDDKELPADIIDKRWIHLTDGKQVLDGKAISLKGKGDGARFKLFLLYFTRPADASDPRVAVGNVELRATL
jgi:hypothetical protein